MKTKNLKPYFQFGTSSSTLKRYAKFDTYPQLRNHVSRCFSTFSEKKAPLSHMIDYCEYGIRFRPYRGRNIIDHYDDVPSNILKLSRNWKHNSRRKKQYYR